MCNQPPVGRFAPTPSGRMHLGNVFAALVAWLSVKSRGGHLVLRMEELDTQRSSAAFAETLRQDLKWLGLPWDEETAPKAPAAVLTTGILKSSWIWACCTPAIAPGVSFIM